jgi:hypothetical protein
MKPAVLHLGLYLNRKRRSPSPKLASFGGRTCVAYKTSTAPSASTTYARHSISRAQASNAAASVASSPSSTTRHSTGATATEALDFSPAI